MWRAGSSGSSHLQSREILDEGNLVAPQVDLPVFECADEGRGPRDEVSIQPHRRAAGWSARCDEEREPEMGQLTERKDSDKLPHPQ